jgi:hypothetical protein
MGNNNLTAAIEIARNQKPVLERETGIEPASSAWKAGVLPLNYSRAWPCRTRPDADQPLLNMQFLVEEAGFEPA